MSQRKKLFFMRCKSCSNFRGYLPKKKYAEFDFNEALSIASLLVSQNKLEVYAADCELKSTIDELITELHYTVKHYLACTNCQRVYFIGGCVRGKPIFKLEKALPSYEVIEKSIWGNVGKFFEHNKHNKSLKSDTASSAE